MHRNPDLTVFYDGFCPLCNHEIAGYKRLKLDTSIVWLDLDADSDVLQNEDFDMTDALTLLHVKDARGTLHIGLTAHLLLWQHLPGFQWRTSLLLKSPVLLGLCNQIYLFFTRHRPGLWRRARVQAQRGVKTSVTSLHGGRP